MRIVSVRIRNLNSISGDWSIRLDGPEYESGGIFAITGPTGAGKSTILDAICLALYGSTPRLDKVTKSSNEIMSRQASDCMAEVRFRTMRGEFLCSWSQNRARGSGNLQQPRHRLYDREGRALAEKTTDVIALVEKLTGMDFARFTQSMLLAQGRFATFLLADGDRRAPLLEKITGTGIYSDISRRVHERSRDEEKALAALDSELAAQDLLSVEEEENLARERRELQERSAELGRREQELAEDMARIEQAEALDREAAALAAEREALRLDEERFVPDAERLERATRATSLSPALEALRVRREEQRRDEEKSAVLADELPRLEARENAEKSALAEAGKALDAEKEAVEKARDLWKRVRAADTELDARRRDLAALDLELETRRTALERREKEQAATEQAQKKAAETLALLSRSREASAADAALADAVGAMETRLSLLVEDEEAFAEAQAALKSHEQSLEEQETALAGRRRSAEALSGALREASAKLEEARKNFAALLGGRDVPSCRTRRDALSARLTALDRALEAARARRVHLIRADELTAEGAKLALIIQKEETELAASRERLTALRETLTLKAKIRSYEEERKKLREGSPCPLCGSLHHPFAEGEPELTDEDEAQLAPLERAMEALTASLAGHGRDAVHARNAQKEAAASAEEETRRLRVAVAALSPALSAALGRPEGEELPGSAPAGAEAGAKPQAEKREETALLPAEAWENDILSALTLTERAPALEPVLEKLRSEQAKELAEAEALLRELDAQEQAGRKLAEDTERLRRMHEKAQADVQSAERETLRLGTEKAALEKDAAARARKAAEDADALRRAVSAFGEKGENAKELASAVQSLALRRDRYAALLAREAAARDTLAEQTRRLAVGTEALTSARNEYAAASENRKKRALALAELERARQELFGLRSVDDEEKAAQERLRAGEEQAEKLRESLENASRALSRSRSDAASLAERMLQRGKALTDMEAALREHLAAERFADEEECRAALLPRETAEQLAAERRALSERAAGLDARETALAQKREAQRTPLPSREETGRSLAETRAERETALRGLGSLQEKLKANAARKSQAALLREKREKQAALCRRWAALNELIGSADGKKFRNYAQELTFRRLIIMANRQLAFMTDRYLLVHSKDEALTLNVIDRYQADAVRSSRNLSGGESFIVSLALALGLAQMASRNVRVDSVFLDEGFGTLDEEALGTALDMLSSLRQKGKMIGIISHVQAVRDRVSLQIRVSPRGGGQSALSGPGVSRNDRSE